MQKQYSDPHAEDVEPPRAPQLVLDRFSLGTPSLLSPDTTAHTPGGSDTTLEPPPLPAFMEGVTRLPLGSSKRNPSPHHTATARSMTSGSFALAEHTPPPYPDLRRGSAVNVDENRSLLLNYDRNVPSATLSAPPNTNNQDGNDDDDDVGAAMSPISPSTESNPSSHFSEVDKDFPVIGVGRMLLVNAFWLGYQLFWFVVFVIHVPYHIEIIVGEKNKGRGLSTVSICSGILNLFLAVIVGKINDGFTCRYGKRKPWIIVGSVMMICSFLFMNEKRSIVTYAILYTIFTGSTVICSVPFNGFVADVSVNSDKGRISSVMGGMNLLGYLFGSLLGILIQPLGFGIVNLILIAIFIIGTIVTVFSIKEIPSNYVKRIYPSNHDQPPMKKACKYGYSLVAPLFESRNFLFIFLSRFFYQLTIAGIQQFMQYWLSDCTDSFPKFHLSPHSAVSYAFLPLMITSPIAAFFAPTTKRIRTVAFSSLMMGLVLLCLMVCHSFIFAIVISFLFGLAYGPFMSTEFAMLMDVIPEETAARDVALWHSALVLPQILGTPLEGFLLDSLSEVGRRYGNECLRYNVIWAISLSFVVIGWMITTRITGLR